MTKILTVRSILVTIGATIVGTVALAYIYARSRANVSLSGPDTLTGSAPESLGFYATSYSQIGFIVLGVLVAGSEYMDGQIRVSLAAVPRRSQLLMSKTMALSVTTILMAALSVVMSFWAAQIALGDRGALSLTAGTVPAHVGGAVGYLTLMGLCAFAASVITRTVIAPMVILIALSQAVSTVLARMADPFGTWAKFMPDLAGKLLFGNSPSGDILSPVGGGLVMAAWVGLLLVVGFVLFSSRDA